MVAHHRLDPGARAAVPLELGEEVGVESLENLEVERRRDPRLAAEVVVEAPDADAGPLEQVLHAAVAHPGLEEQLERRV